MSETQQKPGSIGWMDLTVADATGVRDFYQAVVGLTPGGVEMGGYEDYCMTPPGAAAPVCGVCHARGANADLPPVWIPYFIVSDIESSLAASDARGGTRVTALKSMGAARYCVVRDPAGAVCALYQP